MLKITRKGVAPPSQNSLIHGIGLEELKPGIADISIGELYHIQKPVREPRRRGHTTGEKMSLMGEVTDSVN